MALPRPYPCHTMVSISILYDDTAARPVRIMTLAFPFIDMSRETKISIGMALGELNVDYTNSYNS